MAIIYLISIKTLKEEYLIDDNLEDRYIESNIIKGQRFIINGILGDDKYNEILDQYYAHTLSTQNTEIVEEYIQPILAYYVMSEAVYSTAYKFKNANIVEETPNSDRFDELVKISKKYLRDSEQFQQLLKDYLCRNGVSTNNIGKKNVVKTGIYIESNRYDERYRKFNSQEVSNDNGNNCIECRDNY